MRHLILQRWEGELGELERLSCKAVEAYAESIGADYHFETERPLYKGWFPPLQKLDFLSCRWDAYDVVVMMDTDMFPCTVESVFDVQGVGLSAQYHQEVALRLKAKRPNLIDLAYPYWGGALYKMGRELRRQFRFHATWGNLEPFNGHHLHGDEGAMHRLAQLADYKDDAFIPERWAIGNWQEGVEGAACVHMSMKARGRPRSESKGREQEAKLENYRECIRCGILT